MNQKIAVSVVFVLALFMNIMDITIVNTALPTLGKELHASAGGISAVSIGYLVSLAVVIPASGWLGDRFGSKRVLLVSIVLFTGASALCGAAQDLPQLVGFRVLQGIGGGMLTPVGMAMLYRTFPPAERVRASSILVIPPAFAPALGPVLGGILVTNLSWRWVFYVNLPIGAVALLFGLLFLHEQDTDDPGAFDARGFLLSAVGFAALMYGVSEGPQRGWSDPIVLSTVAIGAVVLVLLVFTQLRTSQPLLRLRLFGDRLFRSTNIVIFLGTAGFLGTLYLSALFFQNGLGLSALNSGLSTFPEAIGVMLGAQSATRLLYPRLGPRRVMTGGLVCVAVVIALMALVDDRDTARGSTLFNAGRQLGGAVGVAVLTTVIAAVGVSHAVAGRQVSDLSGYHAGFGLAAALILLAAGAALTIKDEDAASTRVRTVAPKPASTPHAETTHPAAVATD